MTENTKKYDVIIIGAGPAGMTTATYTSRAGLKTLMLDQGIYGGQLNNTAEVENYPGYASIMGPDLADKMYESSTQFGAIYDYGSASGLSVDVSDPYSDLHTNEKVVHTDSGDFVTKAIVIATGSEHIHLGVPGEEDYQGKGVSYCAVCDGAFFKNRNVAVVGGGDSAVEEATYLSSVVNDVTVFVRGDKLKAQTILQNRAFAKDNVHFVYNMEVKEVIGDGNEVTHLKLVDNTNGTEVESEFAALFVYVGLQPNTEFLNGVDNELAESGNEDRLLDRDGWIETDETMETKIDGLFAVGDVRQKGLRQVTTAVGDGAIAGQAVFDYVSALDVEDK